MSANDTAKIAAAAGAGVVALGGVAVVGKKLMYKSPEQRREALVAKSNETEKVLLHVFPALAYTPSRSPYCTRVEAYFRLNNIPYELCEPDLAASPNGCVPYVAYRGQVVADSQKIMEWASIQFNITTDISLSRECQAESKAIRALIDYSFVPAVMRAAAVDDGLRTTTPFISNNSIVRWVAARVARSYVTKFQEDSGYSLYDKAQYEELMLKDVHAIETILRERPYLVGDEPTSVDCNAYSIFIMLFRVHDLQPNKACDATPAGPAHQHRQTAPITGEEAEHLKEAAEKAPDSATHFINAPLTYMVHSQVIRDYVMRMTEKCYPDIDEVLPVAPFAAAKAAKAAEATTDRDIHVLAEQSESIKLSFEHAPAGATRSLSINQEEEKTAAERKAAWDRIREILPRKKTPEDKKRRIDLFKKFDADGSKSLTLEETYKGLIEHCQLDAFTTRLKDITVRAFNKAKSLGTKDRGAGSEDQVEFLEFRLMLCYIYDYFELTVMFDEIDTDGSMMIDMDEFMAAVPKIEEWGVKIADPEATFRQIDDNNSGKMTFDEFCAWASAAKLDADGDPDNTEGGASPNVAPA